jgi:hypothetical protein
MSNLDGQEREALIRNAAEKRHERSQIKGTKLYDMPIRYQEHAIDTMRECVNAFCEEQASRTQAEAAPQNSPWRVGRKVGRTIYVLVNGTASDEDELIGVMDSRAVATAAVEAHNLTLAPWSSCCGFTVTIGGGDPDEGTAYYICTGCEEPCDGVRDTEQEPDKAVLAAITECGPDEWRDRKIDETVTIWQVGEALDTIDLHDVYRTMLGLEHLGYITWSRSLSRNRRVYWRTRKGDEVLS